MYTKHSYAKICMIISTHMETCIRMHTYQKQNKTKTPCINKCVCCLHSAHRHWNTKTAVQCMQIDELMETQANADESMKGHLYKYMHLRAHTLFSGIILKRKGQRLKNMYWSFYCHHSNHFQVCETEEGKNQFLIGEVQGAVKSILFYFQISFREVYTLSEKSGLAGGQRTSWKWSSERHGRVQGKGLCWGQKRHFHLLWQEQGVERVWSALIQIMARRAIYCDTHHLIDC